MGKEDLGDFSALIKIVTRLRAPDGCPWDREQTHASIKHNLQEECYEALEALDSEDSARLCEELGDLLMQVALHAQMAQEAGEFDIHDVIRGISSKLIRRHPHVFGTGQARTAQEVEHRWEKIKQGEKPGASLLDGVPRSLAALAASAALQRRAALAGFDWEKDEQVLDKVNEELGELASAQGREEHLAELGDVLFALANLGRRLGLDPEEALRLANGRFYHRFTYMEKLCRERGLDFSALTFDQQNALWDEAKQALG